MQCTALLKMYSDSDVECNEAAMGEEPNKEISDPQSNRPTQSLGCDRSGFTTLVTRARFYTLPDPMTKHTRIKQGIVNLTPAFLASIFKSIASQVGATSATAFDGGDNLSRPMMGLRRNESHPDKGYVPLADDEVSFHIRPEQSRTFPPTLPSPHHRPSYLPNPVDYARHHEDSDAVVTTVAATTGATTAAAAARGRDHRKIHTSVELQSLTYFLLAAYRVLSPPGRLACTLFSWPTSVYSLLLAT